MWAFVCADSFLPLIHSRGGYSQGWLTRNLALLSYMSHQSHHCHAPIHMHICTHTHTHTFTHTDFELEAVMKWQCQVLQLFRGVTCVSPEAAFGWSLKKKSILPVDKQHQPKKQKYRITSLCLVRFLPSFLSNAVGPAASCLPHLSSTSDLKPTTYCCRCKTIALI